MTRSHLMDRAGGSFIAGMGLLLLAVFLAAAPAALAGTCTWNGSAGNWDTDASWSTGYEPTSNDFVNITNGVVTVNHSGEVAYSLYLTGSLNVESGSLAVDQPYSPSYRIMSTGVLTVNGGTVTMGGGQASASELHGTLTVNGGKFVNTDASGLYAENGHINITGGWLQSLNGPLLQSYNAATHITLDNSVGGLEIASFTATPTNISSIFDWTGGRLRLTQTDLVVAASGILGPTLNLGPTHMLVVDHTLYINAGGLINANEAFLDAQVLNLNGGTLKNPQAILFSPNDTQSVFIQSGSTSQFIRDQAGMTWIPGGYNMQAGQAHINAGEVHINGVTNIANGHFYYDSVTGYSTLQSTYVGYASGAAGVFDMSNGSLDLSVGSGPAGIALSLGDYGHGTFNHSHGTVNIQDGSLTLGQYSGTGIYNLSGGTLDMHENDIVFGNGNPQFNFTGGTLRNVGRFNDQGVMRELVFSGDAHLVRDQDGVTDFYGAHLLAKDNTRIDLSAGQIKSEWFAVLMTGRSRFEQTGGYANFTGGLSLGESGYDSPYVQYQMHAGRLDIGTMLGLRVGYEGTALFNQLGGEVSVDSSGGLSIGENGGFGVYELHDGLLDLHSYGIHLENGLFSFTGGTLKNVGDFYGDLDQQGGTLIVGGSVGMMFVYGNYELDADAVMEIELAGDGNVAWQDHDSCYIDGDATLEGLLRVLTWGGFTPHAGDCFDVLHAESIDTTGLTLGGLSGLEFEVLSIAGGQQVLRLTYIPEPTGAALLPLMGLILLTRRFVRGC